MAQASTAIPQRHKFTTKTLSKIGLVDGQSTAKYVDYFDTGQPGLTLRVGAHSKVFYFFRRVNGKLHRKRIGEWLLNGGGIGLDKARKDVAHHYRDALNGKDLSAKAKRSAQAQQELTTVTLRQAFEDYVRERQHKLKPTTIKDYRQDISTSFKDWWNLPLNSITRSMVAERHVERAKSSEARADGAMRVLRAVYNYAMEAYRIGDVPVILDNPVRTLRARGCWVNVERRTTVIEPHQMPAWFAAVLALPDNTGRSISGTIRDYLLLLILTGLRREEAARLQWQNIDWAGQSLTVRDTKNGKDHTLPITSYVAALLKRREAAVTSAHVFPGKVHGKPLNNPSKVIQRVIEASGVKFCSHDLRRTFSVAAEMVGAGGYTLKRLLNHSAKNDVTAAYVQLTVEDLRASLQRIEDYLLAAGEVSTGLTTEEA